MSIALTDRQQSVLDYIKGFIAERGFPPTRAEIAKHFQFRSPNAAEDHLRLLAAKGAVSITPGVSRGIKVNA